MSERLFSSYKLGEIELKNRMVMAPMTRCRALGNLPGDLVVRYYTQRSEAGLIITEGTSPSPNGLGYARIPGMFSEAQRTAWNKVTDGVHKAGSKIFLQLMHCGRVGHPLNLPSGARLLGPSPVAAPDAMWTDQQGMQPHPVPSEMSEADIENAVEEYVNAGKLAIAAGFDGVELHGANGYLICQFLNQASNRRKDRWGGSIENRIRFATTVASRVAAAIGGGRLGIRLSPYGTFNGMTIDSDLEELFENLSGKLQKLGLVYIHLVDHSSMGAPEVKPSVRQRIRKAFLNTLILSGGYDRNRAESDLRDGRSDLIAFGRPFISNPRLVSLLKKGAALVPADPNTFYTADEKGYTDYPDTV